MKLLGWVPWTRWPLVLALLATLGAASVDVEVSGDDPELDDEVAEDRSDSGWKLWLSPSRLTGFKLSSVTTSLERYQQRLAARELARRTAGMDEETIAQLEPVACRGSEAYRSFDGSCNNLHYGCWGRSGETYGRLLAPAYGDARESPRRARGGGKLPNVRRLSTLMQGGQRQSAGTASQRFTDLTTHFGQFLAHEVSSAAAYSDKELRDGKLVQVTPECCGAGERDSECHEIRVPDDDAFYGKGHCIELVRSKPYNGSESACLKNNGLPDDVREQVNAVTSFIDGSLLYGSSRRKAEPLVDDAGLLSTEDNSRYIRGGLLARSGDEGSCQSFLPGCDRRCLKAGDIRASLTPILGALQTAFLRQHNRVAASFVERGWSRWQVYNVSRKIVGAMIQVIAYREYLPLMIGPAAVKRYGLEVPSRAYAYRPSLNPTVLNAWAAAACRVSHSNIGDKLKREGLSLDRCPGLAYDINNMDAYCKPPSDPVRSLLVGACQQRMQDMNTVFSYQVTRYLFSTPFKPGKDLRAIDYHRARDHGVRPYNDWRRFCGLEPFASFEELKAGCADQHAALVDQLRAEYRGEIDDLDLGVAAILEPTAPGSTFGPTVTCLFGHQFNRLKYGDRFWFENPRLPAAFTPHQLKRLQRVSLAGLICATTDVQRIQRNAFLVPGPGNPFVSCAELLEEQDLDLSSYSF